MGTRSLTILQDRNHQEIAVMYRHYDGYPSGHGQELADFLAKFEITNGVSRAGKTANGMDCLAAQIVAEFKGDDPGGIYLHAAGTRDIGEEWVYTVSPAPPKTSDMLTLGVQAGCVTAFGLPGTKQDSMPKLWEGSPKDFNAEAVEKAYSELPAPPADALAEVE